MVAPVVLGAQAQRVSWAHRGGREAEASSDREVGVVESTRGATGRAWTQAEATSAVSAPSLVGAACSV